MRVTRQTEKREKKGGTRNNAGGRGGDWGGNVGGGKDKGMLGDGWGAGHGRRPWPRGLLGGNHSRSL